MNSKYLIFLSVICTFCFITFSFANETEMLLRDNLLRAKPGDYLVTAQNKNYTLLLIRERNEEQLSIEEITLPASRVKEEAFSWRNWIEQGAPGHTCWVLYTIHITSGAIQQTFSFTKNEWVTIPQSQSFLTTLLNLKLQLVPDNERKKIGPPSASSWVDRRPYWQPRLVVEGKIISGVAFDAWRTKWPKDGSDMSGKLIEIYVPKENDKYPSYFPYWLQVSGVVGIARVRIVDSGTLLFSKASSY